MDSQRLSNGKKKGENNGKCGNKYLAWAYVEAANFAKRYDARCRQFHDRKAARAHKIIATKALACKLAKAAWHRMSNQTVYDPSRMFPPAPRPISEKTSTGIYPLRVDPAARPCQKGENPPSVMAGPKAARPARRVKKCASAKQSGGGAKAPEPRKKMNLGTVTGTLRKGLAQKPC